MGNAPFTVVLADDEPAVRRLVRGYLVEEPGVALVGEASDGPRVIALMREHRPDIAILDCRLPRLSALAVLAGLGNRPLPLILFLAPSAQSGPEQFPGSAVEWIAKPLTRERFRSAWARVRARLAEGHVRPIRGGTLLDRIAIKSASRVTMLDIDSIIHIASDNNRCRITTPQKVIKVRESLSLLASRLPSERFLRVNRFSVIHVDAVAGLESKSHGDWLVRLRDGSQFTVSRTRRTEVLRRLRIDS